MLSRASPEACDRVAGRLAPAFGAAAVALVAGGLALGLAVAPADPGQGDTLRIAVMHYPAAWLSLAIYLAIGALSALTLAFHSRLAAQLAAAFAPTGVLFTLLALWTEALWRRPLAGVWWVWDAEAVSQLLLLFLYGGFVAMRAMVDEPRRAERAAALLALLGVGNLPVLYFSLRWWELSRHEAASAAAAPLGTTLAAATLMVGAGFAAYALHVALRRLRCLIAEREAAARLPARLAESAA